MNDDSPAETEPRTPEDAIFIHARSEIPLDAESNPSRLLPIVVGARIEAECWDRPLGDRIARHVRAIRRANDLARDEGLHPFVITDLWYLNEPALMLQPTITIGEPGVNAASAHWASRVPSAFVVDGSHQVLMDLEGPHRAACMWGVDFAKTEAATDHFELRYLEAWLMSVAAI